MPREFNVLEKSKFQKYYFDGKEIPPAFELDSWVWVCTLGMEETRPTYRFYNCGTNNLRIIRYSPVTDVWEEVQINDIPLSELYSMIWRLTLKEFKE